MKISKDALRASKTLFYACFDQNGHLHSNRVKSVVKRLSEAKPRNFLAILTAFQRLIRLYANERTAVVESVSTLSTQMRDQLRDELRAKYGADLEFVFIENPSLLGGMRVKVGSHVWDGSVRAKLEVLREKLA